MLIFWVTGPHTGRIVTQWRYCKQSKDCRGQTYHQPFTSTFRNIAPLTHLLRQRFFQLLPTLFLIFFSPQKEFSLVSFRHRNLNYEAGRDSANTTFKTVVKSAHISAYTPSNNEAFSEEISRPCGSQRDGVLFASSPFYKFFRFDRNTSDIPEIFSQV